MEKTAPTQVTMIVDWALAHVHETECDAHKSIIKGLFYNIYIYIYIYILNV